MIMTITMTFMKSVLTSFSD